MSFHEKSAWACLVGILAVYIPYFAVVFSQPGYVWVLPAFLAAVVGLVAILVVAHLVFALTQARIRRTGDAPPPDEFESAIEGRATKVAAYVLSVVVISWCLAAYVGIPWTPSAHH